MICKEVIVGKKARWLALWVALLVVQSWAQCTFFTDGGGRCAANNCYFGLSCSVNESYTCDVRNPNTGSNLSVNVSIRGGEYSQVCVIESHTCGERLESGTPSTIVTGFSYYKCEDECSADSLQCLINGGVWAINPNAACGKSCTSNACTAADTARLEQEKQECNRLGGTNDFALVNNGTECSLSGFCDLCNGDSYKKLVNALKKRCCELGHLPDTVKCTVVDASDATKQFDLSSVECSPAKPQVKISSTGETYRDGCDDPPDGSSSSHGSSSSEGSSSSQSSSSSECFGEECDNTDSSNINVDLGTIVKELEDIKDSLSRIILYDSATASNTMDLSNYLYDIKVCLEAGTCGGGGGDTVIVNVERDTNIVNVNPTLNGGLTAEKQAELVENITKVADSVGLYGVLNDSLLSDIIGQLQGIGADSIAHGLDSVRNELLNGMAAAIAGIDSTVGNWGDSTGGVAAGDTAGKGAELDALGDSLAGALWEYPCDTTGGKSCNTAYIGADGLSGARSSWAAAADALGDSLNSGAVSDSVNSWRNKLINNGVLSGNGSATCPTVFQRTYQMPIGGGASFEFGPLSTMVCHDFGFGLTFWALARIVLRAMVAISCMWWLYRAVTGTDGGFTNEED